MTISISPKILEKLVPVRLFARFSIAGKMLLGYMTLVLLTVVVVAYALISLQRINNLNRSIVESDIPVQEAAGKMLDAVLAQDTYEKRFLILKSEGTRKLFAKRGDEYRIWLKVLKELPDRNTVTIDKLENLHINYSRLFSREVKLIKDNMNDEAYAVSNSSLKNNLDKLLDSLRATSARARDSQDSKMRQIRSVGSRAFITTAILCLISILAGALAGLVVTHHISSSINKLKAATEQIAVGNFDYDPDIRTDDEIGVLSTSFLSMGKRLRKLEEMYLDASPLTRLPGGIAIENVLNKRIDSGQPLAFCVLDLDNFKAFNDRYGYANGSEVIKETAHLIEKAVKTKGTSDDFIGHVGGDDYVVITVPAVMKEVAGEIVALFDGRIPEYYEPGDREKGYIFGKTRQGVAMKFPLMTISIAIVTNEQRKLSNALEASEIAAELKDYAKTIAKSVFVIDKRRNH